MEKFSTLPFPRFIHDLILDLSDYLNLPHLPRHSHYLIGSTISCFALQIASRKTLSPYLFKSHYPKLSHLTKFNWDTRVVAWIHAFYATSVSIWVLMSPEKFREIHENKILGYHPLAMNLLAISTGYFLWDVMVSLWLTWNNQGFGFLLHAISCFLVYLYSIRPFAGYFGFVFLFWEISTIFLNPHWFFDKLDMTGSKAQIYNGVALLITFFFSRLVFGNYTSYKLITECFKKGVHEQVGSAFLNTIIFFDVLLTALNVQWFYQMITSVRKRISNQSTETKPKSS